MYTIQVVVQIGNQFAADLFKKGTHIGGLGNDKNGIYINLREKLSLKEMDSLIAFISNLDIEFESLPVTIRHIEDKKQVELTKNQIEIVLEELAKYRKENGV